LASDPATPEDGTLVRAIGVRALAANIINNVVGSGIFVLPGVVAAVLGSAAVAAYLVCAAAIGLVALCLAEAGSRVPASGGTYAYAGAAFGPYIGFLVGLLFWFGGQVVSSAVLATVLVASVAALVPALDHAIVRDAMVIALFAGFAAVNVRGVRSGVRVMEMLTAAKLAPLVLLVVAGLFAVQPHNLVWTHVPSAHDVGRGSLLLIFAFVGTEGALSSSGEVRNPARTVPRAVLVGLSIVAILYTGLQVVSQGVLGPALATNTATPLAAAAEQAMGGGGRVLLLAAAIISAFSYLSGDMLASPRLLYAFGRDGLLPRQMAAVHPRFRTPHVAIAAHAACCCVLTLTGTLEALLLLGTVAILFVFLACCLGVLELRRRDVQGDGPPFRIAGGPVVPVLACGVVIWLLTTASRREYASVAAVLAVTSLLYLLRRRVPRPGDTGVEAPTPTLAG
jgi:basic amino acid/polyamine antiporter, APA family